MITLRIGYRKPLMNAWRQHGTLPVNYTEYRFIKKWTGLSFQKENMNIFNEDFFRLHLSF